MLSARRRHTAHVIRPSRSLARVPLLDELAAAQVGVLSRVQLAEHGVTRHRIRNEIRAGRWRLIGSRVLVLHRGPLADVQRRWVAVLHGGTHAALAAWTAAEVAGLRGFERPEMHIVVPRGTLVPALSGLVVHESRRLRPGDTHPAARPTRVRAERAILDAASWSRTKRVACALAAAAVAQGVVEVQRLETALHNAGEIKHRLPLALALADIGGGCHSLAEIDFIRLCRRADLPPPRQQSIRVVGGRRRYLDAEWVRADGTRVVAEVDGAQHLSPDQWLDDMDRQNEIMLDSTIMLRFPTRALRLDTIRCLAQLARALEVPLRNLSVDTRHP